MDRGLLDNLKELLKERISFSESVRNNHAKGEDAYDPILPRAVMFPKNNEELSKILSSHKNPLICESGINSVENIKFILDNAKIHTAKLIRQDLRNLNFKFLFMIPYSPQHSVPLRTITTSVFIKILIFKIFCYLFHTHHIPILINNHTHQGHPMHYLECVGLLLVVCHPIQDTNYYLQDPLSFVQVVQSCLSS